MTKQDTRGPGSTTFFVALLLVALSSLALTVALSALLASLLSDPRAVIIVSALLSLVPTCWLAGKLTQRAGAKLPVVGHLALTLLVTLGLQVVVTALLLLVPGRHPAELAGRGRGVLQAGFGTVPVLDGLLAQLEALAPAAQPVTSEAASTPPAAAPSPSAAVPSPPPDAPAPAAVPHQPGMLYQWRDAAGDIHLTSDPPPAGAVLIERTDPPAPRDAPATR